MMRIDGGWETIEEVERRRNEVITQEDLDEAAADMAEWDASPEGQAWAAQYEAERAQRQSNPDRLSNRVEFNDLPLLFAQAVQSIFDETQQPCRMEEAGERAGMDSDEYIVACALAHLRCMIEHPVVDGMIGLALHQPVVG